MIETDIGDDTVRNSAENVEIYAGMDNDEIYNSGLSSTLDGGAGNDTIINRGDSVKIYGGDGKNIINNGNFEVHTEEVLNTYAHGVATYKTIFTMKESVLGGSGVTITAGDDNDVIQNFGGSNVTIDAGGGNNAISLGGNSENIYVTTGGGNDSIYLYPSVESVYHKQEKRALSGGFNVTVDAGNGKNFVSVGSGWSYVNVNGGDNADEIFNEADNAFIKSGKGIGLIENKGDSAVIQGGEDGDVITNYGNNAYIQGDDSKSSHTSADYIYTDRGKDVTVDAGKDNDIIIAYHDIGASINGGAGNDHIALQRVTAEDALGLVGNYLKGLPKTILEDKIKAFIIAESVRTSLMTKAYGAGLEKFDGAVGLVRNVFDTLNLLKPYFDKLSAESTVKGGEGDDTIISDGVALRVFEYSNGDGNDEVYYFNVNKAIESNFGLKTGSLYLSTLHITNANISDVEVDGTNLTFKVGEGSIKLVDATNKKFNLRESDGTLTTRTYDSDEGHLAYMDGTDEMYFGNGGDDTIHGTEGADSIYGGDGADKLYGGNVDGADSGKNYIDGGFDNDFIYASAGQNTLIGGAGDDNIVVGGGNNLIIYNWGDGNDNISGLGGGILRIIGASYSTLRASYKKGSIGYDDMIVEVYNPSVGDTPALSPADGRITLTGNAYGKKFKIEGNHVQKIIPADLPDGINLDNDKLSFTEDFSNDFFDINEFFNLTKYVKYIDASEISKGVEVVGNPSIKVFKGSDAPDIYHCEAFSPENNTGTLPSGGNTGTLPSSDNTPSRIELSKGDDTIFCGGKRQITFIYKTKDGNDVIDGFSENSTLQIDSGKGTYSKIKSGSDIIVKVGNEKISLIGAASLQTVNIEGEETIMELLVNGTEGDDNIRNTLEGATIQAFDGNDSIRSDVSNVIIDAGSGNDFVKVDSWSAENISITTGDGDDTVFNISKNATINTGAGNDSVANASNAIIDLSDGDDYIENNNGTNVTITAGKGNDSIRNNNSSSKVLFKYSTGDGDDTISGFNANSTLQIGDGTGTYSTTKSGNDIIVTVGEGKINLTGAATLSTVNIEAVNPLLVTGTDGADNISNTVEGATINAQGGNDTINNQAHNVAINAGSGNDVIKNYVSNVTISAGEGDDSVYSTSSNVSINGGDGNDMLEIFAPGTTIKGDAGNDIISLGSYAASTFIKYRAGDGNDTIYGFGKTSTLNITGGTYSTQKSGSDILVTVGNDKITLVGAASLDAVNIIDEQSVAAIGNTIYSSLQDALNAVTSNSRITLLQDATGSLDFSNLENKRINIDLNKKTFTANNTLELNKNNASINISNGTITSTGNVSTLFAVKAGELNFSNVTLDATNLASDGYIANVTGGRLKINSGNVYSNDSAIRNAGGQLDISNNKTFQANLLFSGSNWSNDWLLSLSNKIDGDLFLDNAALNAGVLTKIFIGSTFSKNPAITADNFSNLIAQEVAGKSGIYNLALPSNPNNNSYVASLIVNGAITYYTSLQDAMTAAAQSTTNGTLTLLKDCAGNLDFSNFTHDGNFISMSYTSSNGGGGMGSSGGADELHFVSSFNGCSFTKEAGRFIVNLNGHTFTANNSIKLGNAARVIIKNGSLTSTSNIETLIENNGGELDLQGVNLDATKLKSDGYIAVNKDGALVFESDTSLNSNNSVIKSTDGQLRIGNTGNVTIKADILLSSSGAEENPLNNNSNPKFIFGGGVIDGDLFLDSTAANSGVLNDVYIGTESRFTENNALTWDNNGNFVARDDDENGIFEVSVAGNLKGENISNSTSNTIVTGSENNDTIFNMANNVTINAGAGDDSIGNHGGYQGANDLIDAGDGNDTIDNHVHDVTLRGGKGNDYIVTGDRAIVEGGEGNDTLFADVNNGDSITISGGTGNDSIRLSSYNFGHLIQYTSGDGDDTISGFNANSTLQISGSSYSTQTIGNDVIVTVGEGSISLVGAATLESVNISGTYRNPLLVTGTDDADNINNTLDGATIQALGGNDIVINSGENVTLDGGAGNDLISNNAESNVTINTAQGDDTIKLGSMVKSFTLDGFNTGDVIELATSTNNLETITGGIKAGNVSINGVTEIATIKNSWEGNVYKEETIAGAKLNGTKIIYDAADSKALFTLTNAIIDDAITVDTTKKIVTLSAGNLDKKNVTIDGGYKLELASDVDTTKENISKWTTLTSGNIAYLASGTGSYYSSSGNKVTYNASVAGANKVELSGVKGTPTLSGSIVKLTASNFNKNVSVASNAGDYSFSLSGNFKDKTFNATAGKDSIASSGNKVTIAAGKGNDSISISGANNLIVYNAGDGNDVINGFNATSTLSIAGDEYSSAKSGSNIIFTVGSGKVTLQGAASLSKLNIDGIEKDLTLLRITNATNSPLTLSSAIKIADASARTTAIKIIGNYSANTIKSGAGNDTLTGGAGADIFVYSAGNDIITDYSADDKISLGAAITKTTVSGSNVVITTAKGKLTLQKAKGKTLNLIDSTGKAYSTVLGGSTLTLTNAATSPVSLSSAIKTADASTRTTAIKITGNKLANSIVGGSKNDTLSGGAGNDTLRGSKGNDSLWGDAGKDTFIYASGDGNDVIYGFENNDMLKITGNFSTSYNKSKGEIYFKVGSTSNAITLKDFTATSFNVNGNAYHISGKKLVK